MKPPDLQIRHPALLDRAAHKPFRHAEPRRQFVLVKQHRFRTPTMQALHSLIMSTNRGSARVFIAAP